MSKLLQIQRPDNAAAEVSRAVAAGEFTNAADKVVDGLEATTRRIGEFPEIGRLRPDIAPQVRSFRSGASYLASYRILNDHVEVVRYVHGRRNPPQVI